MRQVKTGRDEGGLPHLRLHTHALALLSALSGLKVGGGRDKAQLMCRKNLLCLRDMLATSGCTGRDEGDLPHLRLHTHALAPLSALSGLKVSDGRDATS